MDIFIYWTNKFAVSKWNSSPNVQVSSRKGSPGVFNEAPARCSRVSPAYPQHGGGKSTAEERKQGCHSPVSNFCLFAFCTHHVFLPKKLDRFFPSKVKEYPLLFPHRIVFCNICKFLTITLSLRSRHARHCSL